MQDRDAVIDPSGNHQKSAVKEKLEINLRGGERDNSVLISLYILENTAVRLAKRQVVQGKEDVCVTRVVPRGGIGRCLERNLASACGCPHEILRD